MTTTQSQTAPNGWPAALLRGFRGGDADALLTVYRTHGDEIARFLRRGFSFRAGSRIHRFVGYASPYDLHDALHETFRRAFEPGARQGYDGIRPYGPYLRTIAKNVVLQGFRAREILFPVVDAEAVSGAPELVSQADAPGPDPERDAMRQQVQTLVRGFLDGLAPADRRLLEARYVEGLSQRDAAEALGLGRQRLRTREARLRTRLAAYLQARGASDLVGAPAWAPIWGAELLRMIGEGWS